ncbi:hypothetical protein ACLKA7_004637 [Drosophila subpalustris]
MDAKAKTTTTPSGKRTTAASVFKSHHVVRNADIVDVASDASLYCGGNETENETLAAQQQQQQQQQQQEQQPQPTPRAAPRVAATTNAVNPPTPKPRQAVKSSSKVLPNSTNPTLSRSRQRLIKVDFSKLQDDEHFFDESSISSAASTAASSAAAHLAELHRYSQPKMPPYPIGGYMLGSQARHEAHNATLIRPRRTTAFVALSSLRFRAVLQQLTPTDIRLSFVVGNFCLPTLCTYRYREHPHAHYFCNLTLHRLFVSAFVCLHSQSNATANIHTHIREMSKANSKRIRSDSSLDLRTGRTSDALSPQLIELINQRFDEQANHISCSVREAEERILREIADKFETKLLSLSEELAKLGQRVEELEERNGKVSELCSKVEELEAKLQAKTIADAEASIANDVRVHGVPSLENENLKTLLNTLFYSLGLTPPPRIKESFRVKLREHTHNVVVDPVIIIKFESRRDKVMLLQRVGDVRRQTKQPLSLELLGIQSQAPFYINEQLTKCNYNIFKEAMKMKKRKVLSAVFTRRALVYVRQKVNDDFVCLKSMEDLLALDLDSAAATETAALSAGVSQAGHKETLQSQPQSQPPHAPQQQQQKQKQQQQHAQAFAQDEYHKYCDNALESYDLATQCESRRASSRRHTIVGCQSNLDEPQSMPPTRPESRQSDDVGSVSTKEQMKRTPEAPQPCGSGSAAGSGAGSGYGSEAASSHSTSSLGPWNKSFMDKQTWMERGDDRLSVTLAEIVHIRSVMTKAELEGLPMDVRVKEDVERRRVCFLCLRTRFSFFGPWGIQCKLCQRTVCAKCYTKMRIPSEHFRNVPLVLISPSLLSSPASSSTPSPSHHGAHHQTHSSSTGNIMDDQFPKSLIERLLRSESERKTRSTVGSAPSSPKHQRSNMSTPGISVGPGSAAGAAAAAAAQTGQAVEALHDQASMSASYSAAMRPAGVQKQLHYNNAMSRSMEGPRSLPVNSPAHRPLSNSSTLERKTRFSRGFALFSSGSHLAQTQQDQKENLRGEQVTVCNDCQGLVNEITSSVKQKRSSARNRTIQNLTLDLTPVWK